MNGVLLNLESALFLAQFLSTLSLVYKEKCVSEKGKKAPSRMKKSKIKKSQVSPSMPRDKNPNNTLSPLGSNKSTLEPSNISHFTSINIKPVETSTKPSTLLRTRKKKSVYGEELFKFTNKLERKISDIHSANSPVKRSRRNSTED